jgi:hypothetical protein
LSAPYVGHGSAAVVGGGLVGVVTVVRGTDGGGISVVDRGRLLPHETSAPAATISPITARLLGIAALSAQMAPEIEEEA